APFATAGSGGLGGNQSSGRPPTSRTCIRPNRPALDSTGGRRSGIPKPGEPDPPGRAGNFSTIFVPRAGIRRRAGEGARPEPSQPLETGGGRPKGSRVPPAPGFSGSPPVP